MEPHPTEAACLLETGALYAERVLYRPEGGDPVFAGFKPGAFSLYFGDEPIYHVDLEGRWQRAFVGGTHYLKGLDATVRAIDRVREGANLVLRRRTLTFAEASDLDARVRSAALDVLDALATGGWERVDPPAKAKARPLAPDSLRDILERVASWDAAAWFAHRERYLATYGPLPFVPPDSPNALIVQATLGHAGGVAFGQGPVAAHYVRSAEEFAEHARAVARLYGRRILQCRCVFLAGGDVLRRPVAEVASDLEALARTFPLEVSPDVVRSRATSGLEEGPRLDGVHAFLDDPAPPRPSLGDWRRLRASHLRRVILGVESGDPSVRRLYTKAWEDGDLAAVVADLKAAGIGVGLLVLAGAGGEEHAERHVSATASLVNSLALGPGDLVSLLDANEVRDPARGVPEFSPLTGPRLAEQQAALKQALLPVRTGRGAKVAPYSLEKQGLP